MSRIGLKDMSSGSQSEELGALPGCGTMYSDDWIDCLNQHQHMIGHNETGQTT